MIAGVRRGQGPKAGARNLLRPTLSAPFNSPAEAYRVSTWLPAHHQSPPRLQQPGRRRDNGRLRVEVHPQGLSQMVRVSHRQHGHGRGVVPGAGGHWWRPGDELRLHQHRVGHPGRRIGHLFHGSAHQLLRSALWRGHGPAHPWCGLRLHRLDHHVADLREFHLSIFLPWKRRS